jgi:hypothetical protein
VEPVLWQIGYPGQDIGEPGLRIDVIHLGRGDQAIHEGRAITSAVGPAK